MHDVFSILDTTPVSYTGNPPLPIQPVLLVVANVAKQLVFCKPLFPYGQS